MKKVVVDNGKIEAISSIVWVWLQNWLFTTVAAAAKNAPQSVHWTYIWEWNWATELLEFQIVYSGANALGSSDSELLEKAD